MSGLVEDIAEIKVDIKAIQADLDFVRTEALADDGVIDEAEAAEIEEIEEDLQLFKGELADLEAELAAAGTSDTEEEGGFLSDLVDGVGDVVESVVDSVSEFVGGSEDGGVDKAETNLADETEAESKSVGGKIVGTVGQGGKNDKPDVSIVQTLINKAGSGLKVDGIIGPKTIGEIANFQEANACPVSKMIAPGDQTWSTLKAGGAAQLLADAGSDLAEETGSWLGDTVGGVVDALGDAADGVIDLIDGDDELSDEELKQLEDELLQLEQRADAI